MNTNNLREENKKQIASYGPELKNFTNNENNSIIKGAEILNKKLNINPREQRVNNIANDYKPNYKEMVTVPKKKTINGEDVTKLKNLKNENYIPNEKREQERLRKITGAYDLKKVETLELQKHIKLKEKTPDDYYSYKLPHQELTKRVDMEAFGPKTDFSIWNFENNFDKLNNEEKSMMTYKMQREFNNLGYTDADGKELKTDGIFGNKTKSAYDKYTKVNKVDFEDYNNFKVKENFDNNNIKMQETDNKKPEIKENVDYWVLKDSKGNPLYLASAGMDLTGLVSEESFKQVKNVQYNPPKHEIKSPVKQPSDENKPKKNKNVEELSKYSTTVQTELLKLKVAWYMADTQEEKNEIHEEANRIRNLADNGWGRVLDVGKSITGAAADEFSWLLGGDVARAERDFWLSQLQRFDPTIEIEEKEFLRSIMFIASILAPSPDDALKMIAKKATKDMLKTMGKDGAKKFLKAMTKYVSSGQNSGGIKYLGSTGMNFLGKNYKYEVKIPKGVGGGYRLLGNLDDKGNLIFTKFDNPH